MDSKNTRLIATKILFELIQNKISFAKSLENISGLPNHGLIQELCYGVTRWYFQLDFLAKQLLKKSLKRKDQDIYILILVGIYQLLYTDIPSYAVVSETVNTVREFNKKWATDLVNGILRNFLRKQKELLNKADQNPVAKYSHPKWLIERVQKVWPEHWQDILLSNNQHPPMSLRVNRRMITKEAYFEKLETHATDNPHCPMCLTLEKPCPTYQLPGFSEGEVSVQDCGAQLAIDLLEIKPKQRILDACAAPGGKTTHILEVQPDIQTLISIDNWHSCISEEE